jgi:membrane-bound ClpP family serine protease
MVKRTILFLAIGLILFELIEHVILPLIWIFKDRKKASISGVTGMVGKIGEIKFWQESEGQVFVNGELWHAVSTAPLCPGNMVVIKNIKGLTLEVDLWKE